MAIQDYLTLSHLRKVVAAITQRIVGVENSVGSVKNDVNEINGAIKELRNDKEVFVITAVGSDDNTLSATYEEIVNAHRSGKICILVSRGFQYSFESAPSFHCFKNEEIGVALILHQDNTVEECYNSIDFETNGDDKYIKHSEDDTDQFKNEIFNHVSIDVYDSNTGAGYNYADAKYRNDGSSIYISGINPATGDIVIFTQPDSSVNEWTRTIKPGSYSISRSSDTLTLTGSDGSTSTATLPSKTSDLTNDSGFMTGMTILAYGKSTWADFIDAYTNKKVVYCRTSSASNPASGSQTRLAFMAFVNDAENPTNVEFQYYRSVNAHSINQQGDQVYVYKLDKNSGWSVTVRECYTKVIAGTGLTGNWASGAITLGLSSSIPVGSTATPQPLGTASAGSSSDFSKADHVHALPTLSISSNVITLTGASGKTTSITLPVYNGGVSSS